MKILEKTEFSQVLAVFDQEHPSSDGTNSWARKMLANANQKFNGEWHRVRLSRREALGILLVWHHDPEQGLMLIPEHGTTVWEVAKRWKEIATEYQAENSDCYEKIMKFSKDPFSTVFLSVKPIKSYGVAEYEKLEYQDDALVHLDGLHRLIAWAIAGKLDWLKYYFGKKKLNAFVAGLVG